VEDIDNMCVKYRNVRYPGVNMRENPLEIFMYRMVFLSFILVLMILIFILRNL
jgi:hypothetical protein